MSEGHPSPPVWSVYKLTNRTNGKIYIGITRQSIERRWRYHVYDATNDESARPLQKDMWKYGANNFSIQKIDSATTLEIASELERSSIKHFNSMIPNGYNCTPGGERYPINPSLFRQWRTRIGLTQAQVASLFGLSTFAVCRYDQGKKRPPHPYILAMVAIEHGLTVSDLGKSPE